MPYFQPIFKFNHPKQRNSVDFQDRFVSPKSQSYGSHVLRVHMEFHRLRTILERLLQRVLKQLPRHAAATEHGEHCEAHDVALGVTSAVCRWDF